jgi:hypothetical protein
VAATTTTIGPGQKGDFAVHVSVYGKVQVGPRADTQRQQREEEGKETSCLTQAGLSSYLYGLLVMCVHLSMLEVVSTPPHLHINEVSMNYIHY